MQRRRAVALAALLTLVSGVAHARTFYVDPATGANTNDGISPSTPWLNPPGTRTANDTGYWSATWHATTGIGDITGASGHRVQCGDTILVKGGSTQTATQGGSWCIASPMVVAPWSCGNPTQYYDLSCTIGTPITIRVATAGEWTGSAGPFTIDATNITVPTSSRNGCNGGGGICGEINVWADGITIGGNSEAQRLVVSNAIEKAGDTNYGFLVNGDVSADSSTPTDLHVQWLLVRDGNGHGIGIYGNRNSLFTDSAVYHMGRSCWTWGTGASTQNKNIGILRSSAIQCAFSGSNFNDDAFCGNTGKDIWLIDVTAADSYQRGYDFSGHPESTCNGERTDMHVRTFYSLNNGRLLGQGGGIYGSGAGYFAGICSGQNCADSQNIFYCQADTDCTNANFSCIDLHIPASCCTGYHTGSCAAPGGTCEHIGTTHCGGQWPINGCAVLVNPQPHAQFFMNGVLYKDEQQGSRAYGFGRISEWNITAFAESWNSTRTGPSIVYDRSAQRQFFFNSIIQQRAYTTANVFDIQSSNAMWCQPNPPVSFNNRYGFRTSSADQFASFSCPGGLASYCTGGAVAFSTIATNGPGFVDTTDAAVQLSDHNFLATPSSGAHNCDSDPNAGGVGAIGDYGICTGGVNNGGSCAKDRDCLGGTCAVHCNFHVQSISTDIDTGGCYMAAVCGSNPCSGTTVTVRALHDSARPRDYFTDPTTFPTATADTVVIGSVIGTLSALGESTCSGCGTGCVNGSICHYPHDCRSGTCGGGTITFTGSQTWNDGACIYNGGLTGTASAIADIGAFPFDAGSSTTTTSVPTTTSSSVTSSTVLGSSTTSTSTTSTTSSTTATPTTSSTSTSSSSSSTSSTTSSTSTSTSVTATTLNLNPYPPPKTPQPGRHHHH